MENFQGTFQALTNRAVGNKTLYSAKVDNEYYGCGETMVKAAVGDQVAFVAEKNAKGYWAMDTKTFKVVDSTPTQSVKAPTNNTSSSSYDKTQLSIQYQCALKGAVDIVVKELGMENGEPDEVWTKARVLDYTNFFFNQIKNLGGGEGAPVSPVPPTPKPVTKPAPQRKKPPVEEDEFIDDDLPNFN